MSVTTCHMSISLDGFVAGPDQDRDNPVGVGGLRLHEWHWHAGEPGHETDVRPREELMKRRGAYVMGRNMFGPVRGEWDEDWRGWWGAEPPYHAPVFVLTHHPHDPIEMEGATTFYFVTDGFQAALEHAKAAAGENDVDIAGGASTVRQALAAGAIDDLVLDIVPVLLGAGERLFDGVEDPGLQPIEVIHSPHATHVRYRVGRQVPLHDGEKSIIAGRVVTTYRGHGLMRISQAVHGPPCIVRHYGFRSDRIIEIPRAAIMGVSVARPPLHRLACHRCRRSG